MYLILYILYHIYHIQLKIFFIIYQDVHKRRNEQRIISGGKTSGGKTTGIKIFFHFFAKDISLFSLTANFETLQIIIRMTFLLEC